MDERKQKILNIIIKEHIKTGAPVGSGVLVRKYNLGVSPATVRNEMAELENEGYIIQPYTSAGRIPTEKAYNLYIDNLEEGRLSEKENRVIGDALNRKEETDFKQTAKVLAEMSGNAVFWAFHKHSFYYTGISNLFHQPEFSQTNLIYNISSVIDKLDEIIEDIFDEVEDNTQIMIGRENPFGNFCSTTLVKYKHNGNIGIFGILSPMRTDYKKNKALIKYILENI